MDSRLAGTLAEWLDPLQPLRDRLASLHRGYFPAYLYLAGGLALDVLLALQADRLGRGLRIGLALLTTLIMLLVLWVSIVPRARRREAFRRDVAQAWAAGVMCIEDRRRLYDLASSLGLTPGEASLLESADLARCCPTPEKRGIPQGPLPEPESRAARIAQDLFRYDSEARILHVATKPLPEMTKEEARQVRDVARALVGNVGRYDLVLDGADNPGLDEDVDQGMFWTGLLGLIRRPRRFVCTNVPESSRKMLWLFGRFLRVPPKYFHTREGALAWTRQKSWWVFLRALVRPGTPLRPWLVYPAPALGLVALGAGAFPAELVPTPIVLVLILLGLLASYLGATSSGRLVLLVCVSIGLAGIALDLWLGKSGAEYARGTLPFFGFLWTVWAAIEEFARPQRETEKKRSAMPKEA